MNQLLSEDKQMSNWQALNKLLKELQLEETQAGGSLVVYHQGECVLDTAVGYARADVPWTSDTLSLNFSIGKGVLATLVHCLVSVGLLDYDTPICEYWQEFASNGKQSITLRQVMSHQANLFAIDTLISDSELITDWDTMVQLVANMSPTPPKPKSSKLGEIHYSTAYSALVYGWILGELVMRVTNLSIQQALDKYLAEPLGIQGQIYFGLADDQLENIALPVRLFASADASEKKPNARRKPVLKADSQKTLQTYANLPFYDDWKQLYKRLTGTDKAQLTTADINRLYFDPKLLSLENYKSALMPNAKQNFDYYAKPVLQAVIPAVNCVATSQALAKIYAMLANQGSFAEHQLINETVFNKLTEIQSRGVDGVMPATAPESMLWRLGYHRVFSVCHDMTNAFGHCGYNGSMAWCDPSRQLAVVFIHNIDTTMLNDIRQFAIPKSIYF